MNTRVLVKHTPINTILIEINFQEKIDGLRSQINDQVQDLDNQLESILEKHERDFLTAYRFHMLKV